VFVRLRLQKQKPPRGIETRIPISKFLVSNTYKNKNPLGGLRLVLTKTPTLHLPYKNKNPLGGLRQNTSLSSSTEGDLQKQKPPRGIETVLNQRVILTRWSPTKTKTPSGD